MPAAWNRVTKSLLNCVQLPVSPPSAPLTMTNRTPLVASKLTNPCTVEAPTLASALGTCQIQSPLPRLLASTPLSRAVNCGTAHKPAKERAAQGSDVLSFIFLVVDV